MNFPKHQLRFKTWTILLILIEIGLVACTEKISEFKVTVTASPVEGGSTEPAGGVYNEGTNLTITAIPTPGWNFVNWTGDKESDENPLSVEVTQDFNLTANFIQPPAINRVKINTEGNTIVNEPKVGAKLEHYFGNDLVKSTPIGIEYRGKYSYIVNPQKSYGLEIWDAAQKETTTEMFGMPIGEDWILYAPYNDRTFMNNYLIYRLSNEVKRYAVRTDWTELEINGDYLGVYVFMEKVDRSAPRLNLTKLGSSDLSGTNVTGGYIFKIDKTDGETWADHSNYTAAVSWRSPYDTKGVLLSYAPYGGKNSEETYYVYEYPKATSIKSQQKDYIAKYMVDFEQSLLKDDFSSNTRTYTDYIDIASFVDHFLLNELTANPDAYRLSTFLYKDRSSKVFIGPVWDFDFAFGNEGRSQTNQWIYEYNKNYPNDLWLINFWWPRLMQDPQFKAALKTRWNEMKVQAINTQNINKIIDEQSDYLIKAGAVARHFKRWPDLFPESKTESAYVASYRNQISIKKNWIKDRIQWMDSQISKF
ncbi:MAG: CotH kinase family protein [Bacteroidetes bacterium]|nr:CotH kinase family protein [Bacteroidota bacterium]